MKTLTNKELSEAPNLIKYIYLYSLADVPIGLSTLEKGINEYPEYFPKEIERREKWNAIPQEVHDTYFKEFFELENQFKKDIPHSGKGILFYIDHPKEFEEYENAMEVANKKLQPLHKQLHEKHYSKYGIEWNGF